MSAFRPVWIHPSHRMQAQARKRLDSLLRGEIDHGFHYQSPKQAERWLQVHQRHVPLRVEPSFAEIYRVIAEDVAESLAGRAVHVIGLCPGGGWKEALVLEALHQQGCTLRYTPVDTSLELALLSGEAGQPWVKSEMLPIVGDISLLRDLPDWLKRFPAEETRVYTFFGAVHNFPPSFIFPLLRDVLREQDSLLMSANLAPDRGTSGLSAIPPFGKGGLGGIQTDRQRTESAYLAACTKILPQYDNPETIAWLRQVLVDWGIAAWLSEPGFQLQAMEDLLGFFAYSTWLADASFPWEGQQFTARQGERLRLFFSLRYTPVRLADVLRRYGLALGPGRVTNNGEEGVWWVGRVG